MSGTAMSRADNLVQCGSIRSLLMLLGVCFASLSLAQVSHAEDDKFDGAIWTFTITPKQRRLSTMRGTFRVSNHVLFQKETPRDSDYSKEVGKNHPNGTKTVVKFEDLRTFTQTKTGRTPHEGIKGTARLGLDKFGEWSGVFTDSEGRNWEFKCSRVQE